MNSTVQFFSSVQGADKVKAVVALAKVSPNKRRQFLRKVSRTVKKLSNQRRRAQRDIDGQPWKPRKSGKGKMMRRIQRELNATANFDRAMLFFKDRDYGRIAYAHHHGIDTAYTHGQTKNDGDAKPTEQKKQQQFGGPNGPTKAQAKKLIDLGFRINKRKTVNGQQRNGRSKGKIPSLRWVGQNLNAKQVGALIGLLKDKNPGQQAPKQQWRLKREQRPWLGVSKRETQQIMQMLINQLIGAKA